MRKCTNIFTIYEEVVSHILYMTLHPIPVDFLLHEENFVFFFIRGGGGELGDPISVFIRNGANLAHIFRQMPSMQK